VYKDILPENFEEFFTNNNLKIPMNEIKRLLDANSKEIINKLLKLVQPSPGNSQNYQQLKDIIGLISGLTPSNNSSAQEILKSIILLYLPWVPLTNGQEFSISFSRGDNFDKDEEDIALILYISTINIGRFKAVISLNKDKSLDIDIEKQGESENKEIQQHINSIVKKVNSEMSSFKIPAKSDLHIIKVPKQNNVDGEKSENKREILLHPTLNVSPQVMMAAYTVTRVIFELDENISLQNKRETMISETAK